MKNKNLTENLVLNLSPNVLYLRRRESLRLEHVLCLEDVLLGAINTMGDNALIR